MSLIITDLVGFGTELTPNYYGIYAGGYTGSAFSTATMRFSHLSETMEALTTTLPYDSGYGSWAQNYNVGWCLGDYPTEAHTAHLQRFNLWTMAASSVSDSLTWTSWQYGGRGMNGPSQSHFLVSSVTHKKLSHATETVADGTDWPQSLNAVNKWAVSGQAVGAGYTQDINYTEKIVYATETTSSLGLTGQMMESASVASATTAFSVGGKFTGSVPYSYINSMPYSTETWANVGSLATARLNQRGTDSTTKGFIHGGQGEFAASTTTDEIVGLVYATNTDAVLSATLTGSRTFGYTWNTGGYV